MGGQLVRLCFFHGKWLSLRSLDQKRMRNRAKEFVLGYWRTAVVAVLILVFTMRPEPAKLAHDFFLFKIPHFDKAVHFFMFMLMAMAQILQVLPVCSSSRLLLSPISVKFSTSR